MKKHILTLLILVFTLTSCNLFQPKENTNSTATFDEEAVTYKYSIAEDEKEYVLSIPVISLDEQEELEFTNIYSLNPLQQPEGSIGLVSSNLYQNDGIALEVKDLLYDIARYGFGFYQLTAQGAEKLADLGNVLDLQEEDFTYYHGDIYQPLNHDDPQEVKWYLATQLLIWEQLLNPETEEAFDIQFEIDVSQEKAEIQYLLDHASDLEPDFGGSIQTLNDKDIDEEKIFSFTDSNQTLHNYSLHVEPGIDLISNEEYTLETRVTKEAESLEITFAPLYELPNQDSYYFSSVKNYGYFSIGNDRMAQRLKKLTFKLYNPIANIKLHINTSDVTNNTVHLAGAKYQISQDIDFKYATDSTESTASEFARFENLSPGNYYLRQVQAPEGYVLNQEEPQQINIEAGISEKTIPFMVSPEMTPSE